MVRRRLDGRELRDGALAVVLFLATAGIDAGGLIAIVLVGGLVAGGVAAALRARRGRAGGGLGGFGGRGSRALGAAGPAQPERSSVRALRPGDVVNHDGRDWIVGGTLRFDQDGFRWDEHLLEDIHDRRWLSVEEDEGLEVVLWERVAAPELEPGPNRISHGGTDYALEERGRAAYTAEGTTGTPPSGQAEFADYAAGERRLSFERYTAEGSWEVSAGTVVPEHMLDVYPGSLEKP